MPIIAPSLTFESPQEYTAYMEKLAMFATHVHIDVMDGDLAPSRSLSLAQVWWPESVRADVHVMYRRPLEHTEQLVSMNPRLVIVHPEALGDLQSFGEHIKKFGIQFGVVLMPGVTISSLASLLAIADHLLVFSGKLGFYGGHVDPHRLRDVASLKRQYPKLEIGWDGGANQGNVRALATAGVEVINVGGALARESDPARAYATMEAEIRI